MLQRKPSPPVISQQHNGKDEVIQRIKTFQETGIKIGSVLLAPRCNP